MNCNSLLEKEQAFDGFVFPNGNDVNSFISTIEIQKKINSKTYAGNSVGQAVLFQ